jgi:hypothetical protein
MLGQCLSWVLNMSRNIQGGTFNAQDFSSDGWCDTVTSISLSAPASKDRYKCSPTVCWVIRAYGTSEKGYELAFTCSLSGPAPCLFWHLCNDGNESEITNCLSWWQAATQETLKRLSLETLMAVLQSDNLRVPSELHVFHAVLTWLDADPGRSTVAAQVRRR